MSNDNLFSNANLIYSYSRAQALEDGELVDATQWASAKSGFRGGFKIPVAFTRALFGTLENIPEESSEDLRGRAHDVLFMASVAARKRGDETRQTFNVIVTPKTLTLMLDIGPGDLGEPVITIGFPEDF